jgi:hypothetical protein
VIIIFTIFQKDSRQNTFTIMEGTKLKIRRTCWKPSPKASQEGVYY